jgi:hypothetical protein
MKVGNCMRVNKVTYNYIAYVILAVSIFIAGILVGSYITKHTNSIANFLIYQRTNISIALLTGILSGAIVGIYFEIKQKHIETLEYLRILISQFILICQGLDDFLKNDKQDLLEEYLIKDHSLYHGYAKYRKFMDKEMQQHLQKILDLRTKSENAYRNIKSISNAINNLKKRKEETNRDSNLRVETIISNRIQIESYIDSYKSEIITKRSLLAENRDKISDLEDKIFRKLNNIEKAP